jgi:CHAD domain-containing protein
MVFRVRGSLLCSEGFAAEARALTVFSSMAEIVAPTSSKWISGLRGDMPLVDAARRVLEVRLAAVAPHLGMALGSPYADLEHVHQLRVSTRRAVAALDLFERCLPSAIYRSSRRFFRDIRRASGAARDWDVFIGQLPVKLPERSARRQPGVDFLRGYALGHRLAAQRELEEATTDHPESIEQRVEQTVAAVQDPGADGRTLGQLGRETLPVLLCQLEDAMVQNLNDYARLHRVRITGKRLRYAMEIFVDCYPPAFRDMLYPMIEEVQDILGRANDSFVAGQRLCQLTEELRAVSPMTWKRLKPAIDHLVRFHAKCLPQERNRFEQWRNEWREKQTRAVFAALLHSAGAGAASG